jgi:hypothetical protein
MKKPAMNLLSLSLVSSLLAAGTLLGLVPTAAVGSLLTLSDSNSTVIIAPTAADATASSVPIGMDSWTVNGVNQLQQQWFWYALNGGSASSIDTLGNVSSGTYSGPPGSAPNAYVGYTGSNLSVGVTYTLQGASSSSGQSDIGESIRITNNSASTEQLQFFEYSHFILNGSNTGETLQFGTNSAGSANSVTESNGMSSLEETVVTPAANRYEGEYYPVTWNKLNSPGSLSLADQPAIGVVGPPPSGQPGDVTWAFEWDDATLAPGASLYISKDKRLDFVPAVPEPSTLALSLIAALGLGGCAWRRRRRR